MVLTLLLELVACVASPPRLASKDAPPLPFADHYDQAFAEAATRNVPVLILDFDSWESVDANHTVAGFYEDAEFRKVTDDAVLILASQGDHGSKRQKIDGVDRPVCQEFGGTLCSDHLRMLTDISRDSKVFAKIGVDGAIVSPLFVAITPEHEVVGFLAHEELIATVVALLKSAQKKVGPGLSRAAYLRLLRGLDEAKSRADLGEYPVAVAILEELSRIPGEFKPNAAVKTFLQSLEPKGRELMQVAERSWTAKDPLEAMTQMDDVATGFGKLAVARDAATRVATWEKSPEGKPVLPALRADRAARQLYLQAQASNRAGESAKAIAALDKLLSSHSKSRFAERARTLLATLRPNPKK